MLIEIETNPEKAKEKMLGKFGDYHPGIVDSLRFVFLLPTTLTQKPNDGIGR